MTSTRQCLVGQSPVQIYISTDSDLHCRCTLSWSWGMLRPLREVLKHVCCFFFTPQGWFQMFDLWYEAMRPTGRLALGQGEQMVWSCMIPLLQFISAQINEDRNMRNSIKHDQTGIFNHAGIPWTRVWYAFESNSLKLFESKKLRDSIQFRILQNASE